MRTRKIVVDSSADLLSLDSIELAVAPLKVIAGEKEFTDNAALDVDAMVKWFDTYKGKSKTSCPNPKDWLDAFGDADEVYCVTITSGLSGSWNAACIAKQMYEEAHSNRQVCVVDSLSAGPELVLLIEKLEEYIGQGVSYGEICEKIQAYQQQTGLVFMLASLKNFAANGRVSSTVAKLAGVLSIRILGRASKAGTLEVTDKCRGEAKSLSTLIGNLRTAGFCRGKVRIAHCENEAAAENLKKMLLTAFPHADVKVHCCRGLCSYYAEKGGLLVGFEKQ